MQQILKRTGPDVTGDDLRDFSVEVILLPTGNASDGGVGELISILPAKEGGVRLFFRDGSYHEFSLEETNNLLGAVEDPGVTRGADTETAMGPGNIMFRWATDMEADAGRFHVNESEAERSSDAVVLMIFSTGERILVGGYSRKELIQILTPIIAVGDWRRLVS
jgi:hypothetical protein